MSKKPPDLIAAPRVLRRHAPVFAALGDETRLSLVAKLSSGTPRSIAQLASGSSITRQGITRHLRVLEEAGLVRSEAIGRDCVFELTTTSLEEGRDYLNLIAQQWTDALTRLKNFVDTDRKKR